MDEYGPRFKCKKCRTELEVEIDETEDGPEFWLIEVLGVDSVAEGNQKGNDK